MPQTKTRETDEKPTMSQGELRKKKKKESQKKPGNSTEEKWKIVLLVPAVLLLFLWEVKKPVRMTQPALYIAGDSLDKTKRFS